MEDNRKTLQVELSDWSILKEEQLARQKRGMKKVTLTGIFHELMEQLARNEEESKRLAEDTQ